VVRETRLDEEIAAVEYSIRAFDARARTTRD
jgi:hypothetical protein